MTDRKSFSGSAVGTTLSSGISDTTLSIPLTSISNFPDTAVGPFVGSIDRGSGTLEEKVLIASYTGTTLTISERGYDGTTAQAHGLGATFACTLDADTINQANEFVNANGTVLPSTSAVGDSASEGTSPYSAAGDHKHGRETFATGVTTSTNPGDTEADGTSVHPARADHGHALDPWATSVSTSAVGDAEGPGSAATFARGDHKHGREGFGVTLSTVSAPGDAIADGVSLLLARADHKHGREAGMRTATVTVVTPGPPRTINVTMTIGGGTITGIPVYTGYTPTVGDLVYVLELGNNDSTAADLLAIGTVVAPSAAPPVPAARMYLANNVAIGSGAGLVQQAAMTQDYAYGGLLVSTNAITVNAKGIYSFEGQVTRDGSTNSGIAIDYLRVNGTTVRQKSIDATASAFATPGVGGDILLNLNDVVTLWASNNYNCNSQAGTTLSWLSCKLVTLVP